MIRVATFPFHPRVVDLARASAAIVALGALAIGATVLLSGPGAGADGPAGVIAYTSPAGDAAVRPNGRSVDPPPLTSPAWEPAVLTNGGLASPDGRAVAMVQQRADGAWLSVWEETGVRRLSLLAGPEEPPLVSGTKTAARAENGVPLVVAWSPDGRYLAYGSVRGAPFTLHVVERSTWRVEQYAIRDGYVGELAWSPDGERLAISSYSQDGRDHTAYVVAPGGGEPLRLIDGCRLIWSPDGRYLALHRDPHQELGLWIVSADGLERTQVTDGTNDVPTAWLIE